MDMRKLGVMLCEHEESLCYVSQGMHIREGCVMQGVHMRKVVVMQSVYAMQRMVMTEVGSYLIVLRRRVMVQAHIRPSATSSRAKRVIRSGAVPPCPHGGPLKLQGGVGRTIYASDPQASPCRLCERRPSPTLMRNCKNHLPDLGGVDIDSIEEARDNELSEMGALDRDSKADSYNIPSPPSPTARENLVPSNAHMTCYELFKLMPRIVAGCARAAGRHVIQAPYHLLASLFLASLLNAQFKPI
eukprot:1353542-Amorphochlora_amoeboformis.AAC.1